eukprot:s3962_g9.t1
MQSKTAFPCDSLSADPARSFESHVSTKSRRLKLQLHLCQSSSNMQSVIRQQSSRQHHRQGGFVRQRSAAFGKSSLKYRMDPGHCGDGPLPVWPPSVWWSDADGARRLQHWQEKRSLSGLPLFTHVCNAAAQAVPLTLDERVADVSYLDLDMRDEEGMTPGTGTWLCARRDLHRAVTFVEAAIASGGTVLVNCFAGMNRSGAILLAWLLLHRESDGTCLGFTADGAASHLRSLEPFALNNQSLLECALSLKDGPRPPCGTQEHWILRLPEKPAAAPEKRVVEEFEDSEDLMPLI